MPLRDEIRHLIGGGCPDEEIVSALTMTGSNPDSVRRVLNELRAPEAKPTVRRKVDRRAKPEERESTLDRRVRLFHTADGLTREQIAMEMPDVSSGLIDAELAIMLKVVCGHPPILRLDGDVYRITTASADLENTGLEGNRRVRKGETKE